MPMTLRRMYLCMYIPKEHIRSRRLIQPRCCGTPGIWRFPGWGPVGKKNVMLKRYLRTGNLLGSRESRYKATSGRLKSSRYIIPLYRSRFSAPMSLLRKPSSVRPSCLRHSVVNDQYGFRQIVPDTVSASCVSASLTKLLSRGHQTDRCTRQETGPRGTRRGRDRARKAPVCLRFALSAEVELCLFYF